MAWAVTNRRKTLKLTFWDAAPPAGLWSVPDASSQPTYKQDHGARSELPHPHFLLQLTIHIRYEPGVKNISSVPHRSSQKGSRKNKIGCNPKRQEPQEVVAWTQSILPN
jgi:hypothetical protein